MALSRSARRRRAPAGAVGPTDPDASGDGPTLDDDERLRFVTEAAGLGRWDLDLVNGAASRSPRHDAIFGYPEPLADWTYEMFLDHVLPGDRAAVDDAFRQAVEDTGEWDFECQIRRADGAVRWIWARGRLWRTGDGGPPSRMLGVVADVTERRAGQAALHESERLFHRALADAPFPVFVHADDGEVLQLSRAFTEITGYAPAEVPTVDAWVERAYDPDRREAVRADVRRLHEVGARVDEGEYAVRTADGETRVWAFRSAPLGRDARGRSLVVSMAADVTARHRAERELRRVSGLLLQAEEHERRRLARELHDELGGLLTSLQIAIGAALPADSAALARARSLVHTTIGAVRDLSLDLRPTLLDDLGLAPALRQLAGRFSARTGIAVDLRSELADGERLAPEVETAAYRVVQEALTNAARHAGADRVQVLSHRDPGRLVVHVADEGAGFDPTAVDEAASGGLAGMRERAGLAGGTLEVTSEPGAGTRVTLSLPAGPADAARAGIGPAGGAS